MSPTTHDRDRHEELKAKDESDRHVGGAKYKGFLSEVFKSPIVALIVIFLCSVFASLIVWLLQF